MSCPQCHDVHPLYQCPEFKALSIDLKQQAVQRFKACLNCLGAGHMACDCMSKRSCRVCGRKHHSFLHRDTPTSTAPPEPAQPASTLHSTAEVCNVSDDRTVILATCKAQAEHRGKVYQPKSLIDTGSTLSFITSTMVQSMKLRKIPAVTSSQGFSRLLLCRAAIV